MKSADLEILIKFLITFIEWSSCFRYTDKHDCSFDYKAMGEKEISEANPVIVAAKLNKI